MAFANRLSAGIGVSTSCTSSRSTPVLATSRSRSRLRSGAVHESTSDSTSCETSATPIKRATSEIANVIDMMSLSDLDVDDTSHDEHADDLHDKGGNNNHPAQRVGHHDVDIPRRNRNQDRRDRHRQKTKYPSGHPAVRADGTHVAFETEPLANQGGQVVEHLSEVAARLALRQDRRGEEPRVEQRNAFG